MVVNGKASARHPARQYEDAQQHCQWPVARSAYSVGGNAAGNPVRTYAACLRSRAFDVAQRYN
jgi:hypothetical protein